MAGDLAPSSREPNAELDQLLDEALEDFEEGPSPDAAASPPRPAPSTGQQPGPSGARATQLPAGLGGMGLGPPARGQGRRAAAGARGMGGGTRSHQPQPGAVPPDLPDRDFNMITDSFNKLMEELAQVEQTAQDEAGPPRSDSAGDLHSDAAPGTSPGDQNLAATLQALAKQTQSLHRNTRVPQDSGNMLDPAQLTRLAAQMEALGGGGEVDPNMPLPEGVSGFMNDLMQSLLSKDVLYGSMKEIGDKYPQWLQDHRDTLSALELERYERQHQHIRDICHLYETDPNNFTRLVDLLQQMQACGSPPKDIVDELAPGLEMGADGLPKMPGDAASACCIQ